MISKNKVIKLAQERIDELDRGLFIVEVRISASNVIHVELDKEEGNVAVEDCVSVSRNIEHNLDRDAADFELHVSSAGLDKPLRVLPQYLKNIGRNVTVKLKDNTKEEGELIRASEQELTIRQEKKVKLEGKKKKELVVEEKTFALTDIKDTKIVISFK
ncbi:MAG: ribosome assembly cofactor RimP [Crocinitomicaceae bacterium]|jgi:ribosome maturation factor RimP|nr:ribosome assembly cofactor RimP [Crocinitomicaceae bacterium]